MEFTSLLFYAFSLVLVVAALRVITARNPVHAVLFLVLSFFSAAGIWMLLKAEFLALVLVLVYVGAVMVLFLFVVMMLDINIDKMREGFWRYLPIAAFVGAIIVLEMAAVLLQGFMKVEPQSPLANINIGGTRELGILLYTEYIYGFEIAAAVLLVAIVAAVALTLRGRKDRKHFDPSDAVKVKARDRLRIVKMKSEPQEAAGNEPAAPEPK